MKFSCTFMLLSFCLPVLLAGVSRSRRSLWDLRHLIECALPSSWPVIEFADYGCYCGKGGSGTAVDQLDRCCETHDHCYNAAMALPACASFLDLDNPYTHGYNYQCDHATKTITCLVLAGVSRSRRSLWDLRHLIECALPSSWPVIEFADYGCYCGKGGSGTAVDQLDRCCETHDHCYNAAMALPACASFLDLDNPYTHGYNYQCDHATKTITCLANNDVCRMFICECDKHLAQCMSTAPYISAHYLYDQALCHQHS